MNQESNIPSHDAHSEVAKPAFDARAHLDAIIGSSEDAIIGEDLTGIIVSWNESASRIFGYSANEIIGQSILMLLPPKLHHEEDLILSKLRAGERIDHMKPSG